MFIYFWYALILGLLMSLIVLVGSVIGNRRLILAGMIFSALIASPIISFTRGAAGAVYASDLVGLTLLVCLFFSHTRALMFPVAPKWYRSFFWLMILAMVSVLFVAPLATVRLAEAGLREYVRSPIPGVPLVVLMAIFRLFRIIFYLIFFVYACRLLSDEKSLHFVYKAMFFSIIILAICQIITFFGIKDMGLYLPGLEYQEAHILGHPKAVLGRLYLVGILVSLILLYRSLLSPVYLLGLGTIVMGLLFSGSRAGFVAVLMGFAILALRGKLILRVSAVLLLAAIPFVFIILSDISPERVESFAEPLQRPMENPRWIIWGRSLGYLVSAPYVFITGVGFSNFRYALIEKTDIQHAHSDIITCLTEMGLIGTFIFLWFVIRLGRGILGRIKWTVGRLRWQATCMSALFVGFLVTGLFEYSFYYSPGAACMQRILAVLFGTYTAFLIQQDYYASSKAMEIDSELRDESYLVAANRDNV